MTFSICLIAILLGMGPDSENLTHTRESGKIDTLKIWPFAADRIAADPLGHYYLIHAGSLVKYDPHGDSVFSWSEPQSGPISGIDASDPMRILVYQKDFNLLRFLNNRLAPLSGPVSLDDIGLTTTLAIAASRRGGFWALDGNTRRIRHVGHMLNTGVESVPLNLPYTEGPPVYQLIESGDHLFLLIPDQEIQVFDLFANFIKIIPTRALSFKIYGTSILMVHHDTISIRKDAVTPEEIIFSHSGAGIKEACLFQNKLLISTSDQVILITL